MVMHRQRVGLVIIAVAGALVAVVAGLRPHQVNGAAQAMPVPGPPAVGDCVVNPVPDPIRSVHAPVTAESGGAVPVYPAQQIRPCLGVRYGEITAVIAIPKPAVVTGDHADDRFLDDPNRSSCFIAAEQYLGMTTPPTQRFWPGTDLQFTSALSRPSPRQQAAGQRWAACIVTLPTSEQATAASQYGSSIRDAVHTGRYRDQLGTCVPSVDWAGGFIICSQPHALEVMGYNDSGDQVVTRDQVQRSCQQLVHQVTAMADPTAGGALSIQIGVTDNNGTPDRSSQVPAHSAVSCGVATTGNRTLRGSLIALGRQPIPWA